MTYNPFNERIIPETTVYADAKRVHCLIKINYLGLLSLGGLKQRLQLQENWQYSVTRSNRYKFSIAVEIL
jgi:hypothetical protein